VPRLHRRRVASLLYDSNAKTREISAWWLRRRIFGVFGPNEVYQQTLNTLAGDTNPVRRAYAANALGEFLAAPGVAACATALTDTDPGVRAAAATALGRLNSDGSGALAIAFGDADPTVKLAALAARRHAINSFSGVPALAALTTDSTADVRRRSIEVMDALRVSDAVVPVVAAAQHDSDRRGARRCVPRARLLWRRDGPSRLADDLDPDANGLVRDQAKIAMLRLYLSRRLRWAHARRELLSLRSARAGRSMCGKRVLDQGTAAVDLLRSDDRARPPDVVRAHEHGRGLPRRGREGQRVRQPRPVTYDGVKPGATCCSTTGRTCSPRCS
jgi:hypothetical protein